MSSSPPPSPALPATWEYVLAGTVAIAFAAWALFPSGDPARETSREVEPILEAARAYRDGGQPELALVELGRAAGREPGSAAARGELGRFLSGRGHLGAAESELRAALALKEDVPTLVELGLVALRQGKSEDAVARFRRATELDPASVVSQLDLCIALLGIQRAEEAVKSCSRAVTLDPKHPDAQHNLGLAFRLAGKPDQAIATLTSVLASHPARAITLYELGEAYLAKGDQDHARETFRKLLAIQPAHAAAKARLESLGG